MLLYQSQRREESLQGKIPLLTPAEVPLDCPEWRMNGIAEPVTGGGSPCLSSVTMSWYTERLLDLICPVTPTVIPLLSDLLVFDSVFLGPCWGLLQAVHMVCAVASQKSCPLSEASCSELIAPKTAEFTECLLFMGVIQKAQFGNEGALADHF